MICIVEMQMLCQFCKRLERVWTVVIWVVFEDISPGFPVMFLICGLESLEDLNVR